MIKRLKKKHAFSALLVVSTLLLYQNCAQAPDGTADGSSGATSEDYQNSLPFAYDAKLDTLAYMSCSEVNKDPGAAVMQRAYFTFRAGAYNTNSGGLALTSAYRSNTSYYTPVERAQALATSAFNANTRLVFSMRLRSDLTRHWSLSEGVGYSQMAFLPPLNDPEIAGPLAASTAGRYLNYFPGSQDNRLMEASLSLLKGDTNAMNARAFLSGAGTPLFLVAAYANSSDELESNLRQPLTYASDQSTVVTTPTTRAFGSGLQLSFGLPYNVGAGETRVLTNVTEYDLSASPAPAVKAASWSCPTSYQFMIVRPEDVQANPNLCFTGADQDVSGQPSLQSAQNAIRRVLPVSDWYVDMSKNCVVPKNTGDVCYGSYGATAQVFKPLYYSASCTKNDSNPSSSTYGYTCPHYVSVCIR